MEEDGDDACRYSDATSVSSVTLASFDDDDDIVTLHEETPMSWKHCKVVSRDDSIFPEGSNPRKLPPETSDERSAIWWNDQGDKYKEIESYELATQAYQNALKRGVGLELVRAYTGLGSVHIALGDVNSALQCRNLANAALVKADAGAGGALSLLRHDISLRSFADDELNELFCKVTTLD